MEENRVNDIMNNRLEAEEILNQYDSLVEENEQLKKQLHHANQKLNSIRTYTEMPVPSNELVDAITAVLDDPEHDGI